MRLALSLAMALALALTPACDDSTAAPDATADAAAPDTAADAPTPDATADAPTPDAASDAPTPDAAAPDASVDALADATPTPDAAPEVDNTPVFKGSLGGDRPVKAKLPQGYTHAKAWPLVIVLHGFTATGAVQDLFLGVSERGATRGFITLAPDGTLNSQGNRFWNAHPACCDFENTGVDDVAYLTGLIDEASSHYTVDPARIYLVGHSNGGFMAHRMACDMGDRITAIASIAGSSFNSLASCAATRPTSMLQIHGTLDTSIGFSGSAFYPSATDTAAIRAAENGCPEASTVGTPRDYDEVVAGPETTPRLWEGCDEGTRSELSIMDGSGHVPGFKDDFRDALVDWLLAQERSGP